MILAAKLAGWAVAALVVSAFLGIAIGSAIKIMGGEDAADAD